MVPGMRRKNSVSQPTVEGVITCEVTIHYVRGYVLRLRIHAGDHTTD